MPVKLDLPAPRQKRFIEALTAGGTVLQAFAAMIEKPVEKLTKNEKVRAYAYPKKPIIKRFIDEFRAIEKANITRSLEERAITKEKVLDELAKIAFTNTTDIMEWDNDGVRLKPSSELSADAKAAIADVYEIKGKEGKTVKVKTSDKRAALETLGKHLGLFVEKHQHEHKSLNVSFIIEKD